MNYLDYLEYPEDFDWQLALTKSLPANYHKKVIDKIIEIRSEQDPEEPIDRLY